MTDSGFTVDVDQNQYLPEDGRDVSAESRSDRNRILDNNYRRRLGIARQREQDVFERHNKPRVESSR